MYVCIFTVIQSQVYVYCIVLYCIVLLFHERGTPSAKAGINGEPIYE